MGVIIAPMQHSETWTGGYAGSVVGKPDTGSELITRLRVQGVSPHLQRSYTGSLMRAGNSSFPLGARRRDAYSPLPAAFAKPQISGLSSGSARG